MTWDDGRSVYSTEAENTWNNKLFQYYKLSKAHCHDHNFGHDSLGCIESCEGAMWYDDPSSSTFSPTASPDSLVITSHRVPLSPPSLSACVLPVPWWQCRMIRSPSEVVYCQNTKLASVHERKEHAEPQEWMFAACLHICADCLKIFSFSLKSWRQDNMTSKPSISCGQEVHHRWEEDGEQLTHASAFVSAPVGLFMIQ